MEPWHFLSSVQGKGFAEQTAAMCFARGINSIYQSHDLTNALYKNSDSFLVCGFFPPIWNICNRQIGSSLQGSGWKWDKFVKIFEVSPPSLALTSHSFQKRTHTNTHTNTKSPKGRAIISTNVATPVDVLEKMEVSEVSLHPRHPSHPPVLPGEVRCERNP